MYTSYNLNSMLFWRLYRKRKILFLCFSLTLLWLRAANVRERDMKPFIFVYERNNYYYLYCLPIYFLPLVVTLHSSILYSIASFPSLIRDERPNGGWNLD